MRLTIKALEKMISGPPAEVRDDAAPGLVLRVRASSWSWQIRWSPGPRLKHRRINLGDDLSLEEARVVTGKFREITRTDSDLGPDVVMRDFESWLLQWRRRRAGVEMPRFKPARPPEQPSISYREAVDLYIAEVSRTRRTTTADSYRKALLHPGLSRLFARRVREISRSDAAELVAAVHTAGKERQAESSAIALRGLWAFLARDDMRAKTGVEIGAMAGLKPPERTLFEDDGDGEGLHVPDAAEVGRLIRWLRTARILERDRLACLLLVYTVQRRRAVALARKSDFQACSDGGVWTLPPAHRKSASRAKRKGNNVGVHRIPLPPAAWAVVEQAARLAGDSDFLFPAVRERRMGMGATAMAESAITHLFGKVPGVEASPHDMRRAFGTSYRLAAGLRKSDVALVLDHGARRDDDAPAVTGAHYAFDTGGVDPEIWSMMRGWVAWVESAAAGGAIAQAAE